MRAFVEELRRVAGAYYARYLFRKSHDSIISFTQAVSGAQRAMLIMPFHRTEFLPMVSVIETMRRNFGGDNLTVVTDELGVEAMRLLPNSKFIRVHRTDLNVLFMPNPAVMRQVKEARYDLAVDLNIDLVLPSAYISRASNARVRIGFLRKHAESFYNFQIQPDLTLGKKLIYDRLAQCLQMF